MGITEFMNPNRIMVGLKGQNREEIISELFSVLKNDSQLIDANKAHKAVIEREKVLSTNIGNGFALPHAKTNAVDGIVIVFGKSEIPVYYDDSDNPANMFFLVLSNEALFSKHVKLLSNLTFLSSTPWMAKELEVLSTQDDIFEMFKDKDKIRKVS